MISSTVTTEQLFQQLYSSSDSRRQKIREQIILTNMYLVEKTARRYFYEGKKKWHEPEDVVSAGIIGLMNAVDRYDPNRGVKFSTYAIKTIDGAIQNHFRDNGRTKVPRRFSEQLNRYERATDELSQELGRTPPIGEVVEKMELPEEEVRDLCRTVFFQYPLSLDDIPNEDWDDADPYNTIEDGRSMTMPKPLPYPGLAHASDDIAYAIGKLPEREKTIIRLYYLEGLSQEKIAKRLGCSQMHVSRLKDGALEKIRRYAKEEEARLSAEPDSPPPGKPVYESLTERFWKELRGDDDFRRRVRELHSPQKTI